MNKKITIEHSDRNSKQFGYGLYINAIGAGEIGGIWASECLNKNATPEQIRASEKRVRRKGLYELNKEIGRDSVG